VRVEGGRAVVAVHVERVDGAARGRAPRHERDERIEGEERPARGGDLAGAGEPGDVDAAGDDAEPDVRDQAEHEGGTDERPRPDPRRPRRAQRNRGEQRERGQVLNEVVVPHRLPHEDREREGHGGPQHGGEREMAGQRPRGGAAEKRERAAGRGREELGAGVPGDVRQEGHPVLGEVPADRGVHAPGGGGGAEAGHVREEVEAALHRDARHLQADQLRERAPAGHVQGAPGHDARRESHHQERSQPSSPIGRRDHDEARGEDGGEGEGLDEQRGDERQGTRPPRPSLVAEHDPEHAQRDEQLHERVGHREQSILLERREVEEHLGDERGAGGHQAPAGVEDHHAGRRRREQ